MEKIKKRQLLLALLTGSDGKPYYDGSIDGKWGPASEAAAEKFVLEYGFRVEAVLDSDHTPAIEGNAVMVFSLAAEGGKHVSEHFTVGEFACNDGSDVVLIHPILPVWAEAARTINGPFKPNSAYRTVSYNASIKDASPKSKHCWGIAMDIPAVKASPQELYDLFEGILGDSGGLGLYSWGVHVDCRGVKSRWKE